MKKGHRRQYYGDCCPWDAVVKFLTDGGKHSLSDIEIYYRYGDDQRRKDGWRRRNLEFHTADDLKRFARDEAPLSLEVARMLPLQRPDNDYPLSKQAYKDFLSKRDDEFATQHILVFDWDVDHDIRVQWGGCSCADKQVCNLCWQAFAEPAKVTLDRVLRHWLGFTQILYTFSGRRGFHAIIMDEHSRALTPEQRRAMCQLIHHERVVLNEDMMADLHPLIKDYYERYHRGAPYARDKIMYVLDEPVTIDMGHAMAVPLTPHAMTGNLRLPLIQEPFDPAQDAVPCNRATKKDILKWAAFSLH